MNCDMCGKEAEMYKSVIEGTELTVCINCSKYGKLIGKATPAEAFREKIPVLERQPEMAETVASNFGELLKRKREGLGLKQKEFAKKIAEKESTLHKLETGTIKPTLERARKLEKMLGLKLVEELKEEPVEQKKDSSVMTLGDVVKIKKR